MTKIDKNHYRNTLKDLINKTNEKPIILSGKYKHTNSEKWVTFTTIRPFIPSCKTITICNHININRNEASKWFNPSDDFHNRKFYIIGYPCIYYYYGDERGSLDLAENIGIKPIVFNEEINIINIDILNKCYKFNTDTYKR